MRQCGIEVLERFRGFKVFSVVQSASLSGMAILCGGFWDERGSGVYIV